MIHIVQHVKRKENGVEGEPSIAVGDKVEISCRGLIDFDEEHPSEAVKIVVITVE